LRILQIGCGAFGAVHLSAWAALGRIGDVVVADPAPQARRVAATSGARAIEEWESALTEVDAVSILAPTDRHHALLCRILPTRKPVFIEKPMVATLAEAEEVAKLQRRSGALLQVGMYFRGHPQARWLRDEIAKGALGKIRYLRGDFFGFKRARADSGALENDAVHYLDLFAWLLGEGPAHVQALTRDHFGRGREDLAVLLLDYPGGAAARIEVGYVQPGERPDSVVPGALTTKKVAVSGEKGSIEIDFQAGGIRRHDLEFAMQDGLWTPRFSEAASPGIPAAEPVAVIGFELANFIDAAQGRAKPLADVEDGLALAKMIDATRRAGREGHGIGLG